MADDRTVTVLCSECGEVIEVKNVEALLLALHLVNACSSRAASVLNGGEDA